MNRLSVFLAACSVFLSATLVWQSCKPDNRAENTPQEKAMNEIDQMVAGYRQLIDEAQAEGTKAVFIVDNQAIEEPTEEWLREYAQQEISKVRERNSGDYYTIRLNLLGGTKFNIASPVFNNNCAFGVANGFCMTSASTYFWLNASLGSCDSECPSISLEVQSAGACTAPGSVRLRVTRTQIPVNSYTDTNCRCRNSFDVVKYFSAATPSTTINFGTYCCNSYYPCYINPDDPYDLEEN